MISRFLTKMEININLYYWDYLQNINFHLLKNLLSFLKKLQYIVTNSFITAIICNNFLQNKTPRSTEGNEKLILECLYSVYTSMGFFTYSKCLS